MLSYELAKKLQNAGFAQEGKNGRWYHARHQIECGYYPNAIYIPTLSELLHGCGDNFDNLRLGGVEALEWSAYAFHQQQRRVCYETGAIPDEAVARLWLALNKK